MAEDNDEINRVVLDNSPGNCIMKAPDIQNQIISSFAHFVSKAIICDIGDDVFALLVDEARDVSIKEQWPLLYVMKFGLSLSRVRGQGYDGASNMQGEFNGLKSLILKENKYAFYVHCFAHQLQLALVEITEKNKQLCEFFGSLAIGLNQEATLKRPGDTHWNSYYFTIVSMIKLFSSVVDVLEYLANNGDVVAHYGQATILLRSIECFEFAFVLHLMRSVLGITNDLSQALQKKAQDLANAEKLVTFAKDRLQELREDGRIVARNFRLLC
ncbi:PREDICTED: zinc finger MYM-type protein 1-like [Erythranthe guttata]|uniref:zinc finger MYM-type protein 1-like n=1 Tax=Erythranthe guttata TaxID=4155 RepID=UPI00064DE375|nr:PREDICTED: zinc finger MYM-type protein 1-like [Erythranthe guttata]|eukprot:XP_012850138.1 PREDICTED: zinc finger MYM-type protein 1-like [Erythranthe guttata]